MIQIKFTCPLEYQSEVKDLLLAQGVRVNGIETRYFESPTAAASPAASAASVAPASPAAASAASAASAAAAAAASASAAATAASAAAPTNSTIAPALRSWLRGDGKFPSKRLDPVPASGDSEATVFLC
jgi:hypothetical protein